MSRVSNNAQTNTVQQQQQKQPQVKQKAGENSSFAQKLNQKPQQQKKQETNKTPSQQTKGGDVDTDQKASSAMLARQGAVFGRRGKGSLADLQAQLDAAKGGKGKATLADAAGQDAVAGAISKEGLASILGKGKKGDDGMLTQAQQDALSGGPGGVGVQAQQHNAVSGNAQVIEVKGNTIPTQMLDKIVDQARIGVNAKGAPEFQFDLKGDVLGGLQMKISMEDGKLRASFLAENSDVRRFIDGNLQDLRKALEDKGINVAELEIRDPRDQQRDQQRDQNQKQRQELIDQD